MDGFLSTVPNGMNGGGGHNNMVHTNMQMSPSPQGQQSDPMAFIRALMPYANQLLGGNGMFGGSMPTPFNPYAGMFGGGIGAGAGAAAGAAGAGAMGAGAADILPFLAMLA